MRSFMKDMHYHVRWSAEDKEWVATVDQFPSLSCLHCDPAEALIGLIEVVEDVIDDLAIEGQEIGGES